MLSMFDMSFKLFCNDMLFRQRPSICTSHDFMRFIEASLINVKTMKVKKTTVRLYQIFLYAPQRLLGEMITK